MTLFLSLVACVHVYVDEDTVKLDQSVTDAHLSSDAGDVSVVLGQEAAVAWHAESTGELPIVSVAVQDGILTADVNCTDGLICFADLTVTLPGAVAVRVETEDGDVRLDADITDTYVRTGAGDVSLDGGGAVVDLETGSGDVDAINLVAPVARAGSGLGDIELTWAGGILQDVSADSGAGDIALVVPPAVYTVDAGSDFGEVDINVQTGEGAVGVISAHTGAGDVSIHSLNP